MPSAANPGSGSAENESRRATRHRGTEVTCDLGEIVDLSNAGMRIRCKGKPPVQVGDAGTVKITAEDGAVKIPYETVWVRRAGFRRHDIGLKFVKIGGRVAEVLDGIAQYGFLDSEMRRAG